MNMYMRHQLMSWRRFYAEYFLMEIAYQDLAIAVCATNELDNLVVVPQKISYRRIVEVGRMILGNVCPCNEDLDHTTWSVRAPTLSYCVWARGSVEADTPLGNLQHSFSVAQDTITLMEHLLFSLKYFTETHRHMDCENITMCIATLDTEGKVPGVYWDTNNNEDGALRIGWYTPNESYDYPLRTRRVWEEYQLI